MLVKDREGRRMGKVGRDAGRFRIQRARGEMRAISRDGIVMIRGGNDDLYTEYENEYQSF
jgi:hypothetical protein